MAESIEILGVQLVADENGDWHRGEVTNGPLAGMHISASSHDDGACLIVAFGRMKPQHASVCITRPTLDECVAQLPKAISDFFDNAVKFSTLLVHLEPHDREMEIMETMR